jgi:hypothetical protein
LAWPAGLGLAQVVGCIASDPVHGVERLRRWIRGDETAPSAA